MGATTTLPASINLATIGDTESGTMTIVPNSGTTTVNFDSTVISVALTQGGNTQAISPGFELIEFPFAVDPLGVTITAAGNGSTTLEFVSGKTSVTPTVSIPVTVGAAAEDESYLNKRGLTHFWENIDDIKQDKLTAGTGISISNNVISATGGGGVEKFLVTITSVNFTNHTFTSDKTFDEIKAAYEAGKIVYLTTTFDNVTYLVPLADVFDDNNAYYLDFIWSEANSSGTSGDIVTDLNNIDLIFSFGRIGNTDDNYCDYKNNAIAVTSSLSSRPAIASVVPSGQCVYDIIGDVETILQTLNSGNGAQ